MSLPTTQTADTIKTAAYERAGYNTPGAIKLTRADPWLRNCLNIIFKKKDYKILEYEVIQPVNAYVQMYTPPTDYDRMLDITIFYGTHYDTSTAASAGSITLAADEDIAEAEIKGRYIFLVSGTNANQKSRVTAYNETTKIATVSPNWTTTPAGNEGYVIIDAEKDVYPAPREMIEDIGKLEIPTYFYEYNNKIYFDSFVDTNGQYCMEMRYLLDLQYVDLTDARMTKIYNKLQDELIQGVYAFILSDDDDDRDQKEMGNFYGMIREYQKKDARDRRFRSHNYVKPIGGMPL